MSNIRSDEEIKVFNYCTSPIVLKGQNREYFISGCFDGIPSVEHIPFREIEFIYSRSPVIRSGAIEFDKDRRDEIYEALHFPLWKENILLENDIDRLIIEPTSDNIKKIIDISDIFTLERIRGHLVGLKNDGTKDISNRVINVIEERYAELSLGKTHSAIKVIKDVVEAIKPDASVEIKNLKDQLEQMQKLMYTILEKKQDLSTQEAPLLKQEQKSEPAKRGRTPTDKK